MTCGTHKLRAGRKAIVYVRNSTEMQVGNFREGFQRENGERLAREHGFERIEFKEDLAISGEEIENRPGFMDLLRQIGQKLVGAVVVADISRLTRDRDFLDGLGLYKACRANNTVIITPTQVYDPSVKEHQNLIAFQFMGANMQKQLNVSALMQGMMKAAERGQLFAGHVPLGYDRQQMPPELAGQKSKTWFVKNPIEAQLVERVYATAEHMGARKTAMWLNEHGYRFPIKSLRRQITAGNVHNNGVPMTERKWHATDVLRILRSPLYAGLYVWAGKRRDSEHYTALQHQVEVPMPRLAIISDTRWHAMQALLTSRNKDVTPPRSSNSPYLFSGLIKCIHCGGPMKGSKTRTSDPARRQRIYRCVAHAQGADCRGSTIREGIVRPAVRRELMSQLPALGIERALDHAVHDTLGKTRSESVIADLEAETTRLQEARLKALNLHYAGRLDDDQIAAELERIDALQKQAHRKREAEQSRQRNRITAQELREFMGSDLDEWIRQLKGRSLSRVAKLIYKSFRVEAVGASHRRRGRLVNISYSDDVGALLAEVQGNRAKVAAYRGRKRRVLNAPNH